MRQADRSPTYCFLVAILSLFLLCGMRQNHVWRNCIHRCWVILPCGPLTLQYLCYCSPLQSLIKRAVLHNCIHSWNSSPSWQSGCSDSLPCEHAVMQWNVISLFCITFNQSSAVHCSNFLANTSPSFSILAIKNVFLAGDHGGRNANNSKLSALQHLPSNLEAFFAFWNSLEKYFNCCCGNPWPPWDESSRLNATGWRGSSSSSRFKALCVAMLWHVHQVISSGNISYHSQYSRITHFIQVLRHRSSQKKETKRGKYNTL